MTRLYLHKVTAAKGQVRTTQGPKCSGKDWLTMPKSPRAQAVAMFEAAERDRIACSFLASYRDTPQEGSLSGLHNLRAQAKRWWMIPVPIPLMTPRQRDQVCGPKGRWPTRPRKVQPPRKRGLLSYL